MGPFEQRKSAQIPINRGSAAPDCSNNELDDRSERAGPGANTPRSYKVIPEGK